MRSPGARAFPSRRASRGEASVGSGVRAGEATTARSWRVSQAAVRDLEDSLVFGESQWREELTTKQGCWVHCMWERQERLSRLTVP